MLIISWRHSARNDLAHIIQFIADRNPFAARRMRQVIEDAVLPAAEHPYLFRPGRVAGTREIVAHPNYIVIYQVLDTHIEVLAVLHTRQDYP
ncbi:type II toxin-antitoxin system RelE/ParE family toxin [Nitrospirillum viridazoti]|uniref:Toxin ParE1/3/4 n=1 Tax=Nitrospirillum amazonense TaxID=28077 RepID=A0A560ITW8_9PROT|nr:type II toxin-antitoxin system RelE/ParE family toxin [Nitrospirillum amazonense]TWB60444.1 toxin ParE1/3/4 [Nitrospirillum amazonense]